MSETQCKYLSALFEIWNRNNIQYVILRNYQNLPDAFEGDLDILVHPRQLGLAESLLVESVRESGGVIHNRARFSCVSLFLYDPETLEQIHIDLFPSVQWRGFELIPAGQMVNRRCPLREFFIPHPVDEAVVSLLTKLLYAGYIKDAYKPLAAQICLSDGDAFSDHMRRLFGRCESQRLIKNMMDQNWVGVENRVSVLRGQLILRGFRHPLAVIRSLGFDGWRLLCRAVSPPGICVVMMGPDGCGKTSVGTALIDRLHDTFYSHATGHLHWKPRLLKTMSDRAVPHGTPCTDPHAKPLRSRWGSLLYFIAHSLEIIPAWAIRVYPFLFKNRLVIIDRYFFDFMVDPKRFRLSVSEKLAWGMYRFMPKPDIVLYLSASTEVIQARKKEVTSEETEAQRIAYENVAGRLKCGYEVDAGLPLDQVVEKCERIILEYMARCVPK